MQLITAQPGYWASETSDGLTFYKCPLVGACLPGSNGTRASCAVGYGYIACRWVPPLNSPLPHRGVL